MMRFEYKVVPAPRRGEKARGVKTTEGRFALALNKLMNELGAEGWEYLRADTLPVDERVGFTGTKTSYHNMLVFRRNLDSSAVNPVSAMGATLPDPLPEMRLGPAVLTDTPGVAPALGPADRSIAAE